MTESILSMAKELTLAQIQAGQVTTEEMPDVLNVTYQTLRGLYATEQSDMTDRSRVSPGMADWKKSISRHAVMCLECGVSFRQLSARHLRTHGLDGRSYRDKYGIPRAQSLSARDVLARRREIVNAAKPWELSPTSKPAPAEAAAKKRSVGKKKIAKKAPRKTSTKQA